MEQNDDNNNNSQIEVIIPDANQPVTPSGLENNNNKRVLSKIAVGVLVVLILAGIGSIFWLYTSKDQNKINSEIKDVSNSTTDNLQTFQSDQYYLKFKYPKDWVVTDYSHTGLDYLFVMPQECKEDLCADIANPRSTLKYMTIDQIEGDDSNKSIAQFRVNYESNFKDYPAEMRPKLTTSKLGGKEAVTITTPESPGFKQVTVFINEVQINFEIPDENNKVMSTILESVTFSDSVKTNPLITIDTDEKVLTAANESIRYIDSYYDDKGYFPCEKDFYSEFWGKKYASYTPNYNSPVVDYRPYCGDLYEDKPPKFVSFCYTLKKSNPNAFGTAIPGNGGMEYCVNSERTVTGSVHDIQYYKDVVPGL